MKTKLLIIMILTIMFSGCLKPGESIVRLNGYENNLPDELKGLKIYSVGINGGDAVKVAVINNKINSTTYTNDEANEYVIIINNDNSNEKIIRVNKEYVTETDDLIIIRKK